MKTAKVQEIQSVNEWNWDHWTTFYFKMKMDNWEVISLWKKKRDAINVWDTITYEEYTNNKWNQAWREARQDNQWYKKNYYSEANNRWAMIGMAYKLAFELTYKKDTDFWNTILLANRIFDEAMNTYNKKSDQKTEDSTQTDTTMNKEEKDLPF